MERYWVTHCEWHSNLKDASADDGRDVEVVLYADAQATVEALQRERDDARHSADVYQKLYGTAVIDRATVFNDLSELQALVRELPVAVDVYTHKEGRVILAALQSGVNEMIVCYTDDTAKPIAALLTYRATLKGGDGE